MEEAKSAMMKQILSTEARERRKYLNLWLCFIVSVATVKLLAKLQTQYLFSNSK
jgi:DNA-binding TFAR19-related protein (PDSD5 family)